VSVIIITFDENYANFYFVIENNFHLLKFQKINLLFAVSSCTKKMYNLIIVQQCNFQLFSLNKLHWLNIFRRYKLNMHPLVLSHFLCN